MRPAKIQISLRVRAVWSESSLGAFWITKDAKFLHAGNEGSDQTARMRRLIWVFVARPSEGMFLHDLVHLSKAFENLGGDDNAFGEMK